MHQLHLAMKEMQGEMKTTAAVMEGNNKIMSRLEDIVARHENHLLDGGMKDYGATLRKHWRLATRRNPPRSSA